MILNEVKMSKSDSCQTYFPIPILKFIILYIFIEIYLLNIFKNTMITMMLSLNDKNRHKTNVTSGIPLLKFPFYRAISFSFTASHLMHLKRVILENRRVSVSLV